MIDPGMFRSNRVEFMAIPLMVVLLGALFVVFAVAEIGVWAWIRAGAAVRGRLRRAANRVGGPRVGGSRLSGLASRLGARRAGHVRARGS